jgi:hypothetical protein
MFILQNIGICFQQNFNAWNFPFFFTSKWYSLKSVANVGREFSDVINILIFLLSIYGHLNSRDWYDIECQFGLHYFENKWSGSFGLSLFNFYNWLVYLYRDWFEDELRAFQGGKDGIMPCVWENEISSFPQVLFLWIN